MKGYRDFLLVVVYERVGKSVIRVCERTQRADRWIVWLYKVEKRFYFCDWFLFLKNDSAFTAVKRDQQSSKQGMWKRYHLLREDIQKGYLFREYWYIKGYGVGPRGGASPYKYLLSTPPQPPPSGVKDCLLGQFQLSQHIPQCRMQMSSNKGFSILISIKIGSCKMRRLNLTWRKK